MKNGLCMNIKTGALAQWETPDLESLCVVDGRLLAAGSDGIAEYLGDADYGQLVAWALETPSDDMGAIRAKRIRLAQILGEAWPSTRITYTLIADEGRRRREHPVQIAQAGGLTSMISYAGSDVQGVRLAHRISGAGPAALDALMVQVVQTPFWR
jgi:hypothetical protein